MLTSPISENGIPVEKAWSEHWDGQAKIYSKTDGTLILDVLPKFTLERPEVHLRALVQSAPVKVGERGFQASVEMSVECQGTEENPFGLDAGDPRLAAGAFVVCDPTSGMIFDFFTSNSQIWILYERANLSGELQHSPAFTKFIPTSMASSYGEWHTYEISYFRDQGKIEYRLDSQTLFVIDRVGPPLDNPGSRVQLQSITVGAGIFAVLDDLRDDFAVAGDRPKIPGVLGPDESDLFGQGARIRLRNFRYAAT